MDAISFTNTNFTRPITKMSKSNCERTAMHAVCNLAAVLKVCIAKRLKSVTATGEDGQACARPGRGREGLHALGGCGGCGASRCSFFVAGPSLPPSLHCGARDSHAHEATDHMHFHPSRHLSRPRKESRRGGWVSS